MRRIWMLGNYTDPHHHILSDALNSKDYRNYCEQAPDWIIWARQDTDKPDWIIWPDYLAWEGYNAWLSSRKLNVFILTGSLFTGF